MRFKVPFRRFSFSCHALLLAALLVLCSQTDVLAGSVGSPKTGSGTTGQTKDLRRPSNIEWYYGYMANWAKVRQGLDQRAPINANAPSSGGGAGGGGGASAAAAGGSSGGSSGGGGGGDKWTKQADGELWHIQTRQEVRNGLPYYQPQTFADVPLPTKADRVIKDNLPNFEYLPITAGEVQLYNTIFNNFAVEMFWDPNRWNYLTSAFMQEASLAASNAIAKGAQDAYGGAMKAVMSGSSVGGGGSVGGGAGGGGGGGAGALINIANEASGIPTTGSNPNKTIPQAVWMVQQMYKYVFVPLAILFLLPGAVITQVKAQVTAGFNLRADDASSPFEGILRSIVAIFLIPCTQLIVSYSIDVGNSMAYEVSNWVDLQSIIDWGQKLSYNPQNFDNTVLPPEAASNSGGGGGGASAASAGGTNWTSLASSGNWGALTQAALGMMGGNQTSGDTQPGDGEEANQAETEASSERLSWGSNSLQTMFNGAMDMFSLAIIVLTAFQLVYMCYLYLLGPLSAAFFAWPTVQGRLFRTVFGNWANAVIMLALWRFYWMVILAIMTQRLIYIGEKGGQFDLQWEVAVFTCLLGLMFYVPMNPWNFDPAQAYQAATQLGQQMMGGGGGGDGGGGGGEDGASGPMASAGEGGDHHQPESPQRDANPQGRERQRPEGEDRQFPEQYLVSADAADDVEESPPLENSEASPVRGGDERVASRTATETEVSPSELPPPESNDALVLEDTNVDKGTPVAMLDNQPSPPISDTNPGAEGGEQNSGRELNNGPITEGNPERVAMEAPPISGDGESSVGSGGRSGGITTSESVQPTSVAMAEPPPLAEPTDLGHQHPGSHHYDGPEEGRV